MTNPAGDFYYEEHFQIVKIMESEGQIEEGFVTDLEEFHYTLKNSRENRVTDFE